MVKQPLFSNGYQDTFLVQYQVSETTIQMPATPLRILLYNVGYCTELDGSLSDYFLRFYRYVYTPKNVLQSAVHSIANLVEAHKPDVCCFAEIKKDPRRMPHMKDYKVRDVENKYGLSSTLRSLPFFRSNCNAVFADKPYAVRKHWFRNGAKKLIFEVQLPNKTTLLFAHFSLRASTRKKQYEELKKWVRKHPRVIVCGDFNTFRGEKDLLNFADSCNLKIVTSKGGTFPRNNPKKAIDLFLCSPGVELENIQVLNHVHSSDHLPVLVEMKI